MKSQHQIIAFLGKLTLTVSGSLMRKLPRNPGVNDDGDTFSCLSQQVECTEGVYLEVMDGRLYLDAFGTHGEPVTLVLDRAEAERLLNSFQRLLPQVKSRKDWPKIIGSIN